MFNRQTRSIDWEAPIASSIFSKYAWYGGYDTYVLATKAGKLMCFEVSAARLRLVSESGTAGGQVQVDPVRKRVFAVEGADWRDTKRIAAFSLPTLEKIFQSPPLARWTSFTIMPHQGWVLYVADSADLIAYDLEEQREICHIKLRDPGSIGSSWYPIATADGMVIGAYSNDSVKLYGIEFRWIQIWESRKF
jgi:hypothetical protein